MSEIKINESEIIRLYTKELLNVSQIAKIFGLNHGTINLRLKRNNIQKRTHKETQLIAMNRPEVKELISKKSKETAPKRMATNIKKYGSAVPANNLDIKKQWKEEHIDKHGVEWPNQRKDIIKKRENTVIKKYGVDNVSKVEQYKEKIKQNRWESKTEEELTNIMDKTKDSWLNNLGVDNPLKNKSIKDLVKFKRWEDKTEEEFKEINKKTKITNLRKYGVENPAQNDDIKQLISTTKKYKFINKQLPNLLDYFDLDIKEEWYDAHSMYSFKCRVCGYEFKQVWNEVQQGYLCMKCYPRNTNSKPQNEITEFLEGITNDNIERNNRKILEGKELDIFIPSMNIAIEFNGLYWHSDQMISNENYHLDKTIGCQRKGIRLIHIFEDEWIYNKDIVKERIKTIVSINNRQRIHGRKCTIKEINSKNKNQFLEKFHIQGKDYSTIKLGAFYNNELISVMTFSKGNVSKGSRPIDGIWELNRFCSNYNYHIPGIASKILSYFKKNFEWKEIFSYADRRWSDGNLYKKIGFDLKHITKPNYWYIKGMQRIHRFNLRKTKDDPVDIPEWLLRQKEGYYRIWDCGNYKYILRS